MRAFRFTAPHRTELTTMSQPEPGPGEVLVRVGAAGACHSDLHIIDAPAGAFPAPMTLGHENAGWIEAVGPGVSGWQKGEAVAIYGIMGCGGAARRVCKDARTSAASYLPGASASAGRRTNSLSRHPTLSQRASSRRDLRCHRCRRARSHGRSDPRRYHGCAHRRSGRQGRGSHTCGPGGCP